MNNPLLRNWCVLYFMIKALNVIVLLSAHAPFTAVCTANLKLLVLTSKIPIRYANVLSYANGIMHLASGYDVFGIYIIPLFLSVPVFSDNVIICIFVSKLPFERAYRYLERERIAKAVLFLYTKIVAVFPYTVVRTRGPHIMEERKARMFWR